MDTDPQQIIHRLIDRITTIAVRAYEVESLLPPKAGQRFRRVSYLILRAESSTPQLIEFCCQLTLQAQGPDGERLRSAYEVAVTGMAGFESTMWHINDITDVVADPIDRGDHSGLAPLS